MKLAATQAVSPTVLPEERSVPLVISIPPTPRAIIILTDDIINTLVRLFI